MENFARERIPICSKKPLMETFSSPCGRLIATLQKDTVSVFLVFPFSLFKYFLYLITGHVQVVHYTPDICHNHHNRWLCKLFQSNVKFSSGYVNETALIASGVFPEVFNNPLKLQNYVNLNSIWSFTQNISFYTQGLVSLRV